MTKGLTGEGALCTYGKRAAANTKANATIDKRARRDAWLDDLCMTTPRGFTLLEYVSVSKKISAGEREDEWGGRIAS